MINKKQLPIKFREYFVDGFWSKEYITNLINEPSEPEDYPNSLTDIGISLDNLELNLSEKKILVIGSITPWIECFLLNKGASKIYITDINEVKIDHNDIVFINESDINKHIFDIIISYSSIEHIGLGRYNDEIDENGDLKYMNNLLNLITKNSLLFISIPVSENYLVEGFWHRIYDNSRIEKLFEGYKILFSVKNGKLNDYIDFTFDNFYQHNWQNQPTIILKKK